MECPYCNKRHPRHFRFCPENGRPLLGNGEFKSEEQWSPIIKFKGELKEAIIDHVSITLQKDREYTARIFGNVYMCLSPDFYKIEGASLKASEEKGWVEIKKALLPSSFWDLNDDSE